MSSIATLTQSLRARLTRGQQPLRYVIAGAANTIFGLSIYPLLLFSVVWFREQYLVALLVAQALSLCFAFLTYKFGVFRTRKGAAGEFFRFIPFYLAIYVINFAFLPFLVGVVGITPVVAQLIFSFLAMVGSYFWHKNVTFSSNGVEAP